MQRSAAADRSWAFTRDRSARTKAARDAWLDQLADEVDPRHKLPPAKRVQAAKKLRESKLKDLSRLALKAKREKREKRQRQNGAAA